MFHVLVIFLLCFYCHPVCVRTIVAAQYQREPFTLNVWWILNDESNVQAAMKAPNNDFHACVPSFGLSTIKLLKPNAITHCFAGERRWLVWVKPRELIFSMVWWVCWCRAIEEENTFGLQLNFWVNYIRRGARDVLTVVCFVNPGHSWTELGNRQQLMSECRARSIHLGIYIECRRINLNTNNSGINCYVFWVIFF